MNIEKTKKEFAKSGLLYSPNSIYHGAPIRGSSLNLSKEALLRNQVERLNDFIEFLFEHSEHCDHISQNEAWKEFEIHEVKQLRFNQFTNQKQ